MVFNRSKEISTGLKKMAAPPTVFLETLVPPEDGSDNESFKSLLADTRYLVLDSDGYSTSNYASFGSEDAFSDGKIIKIRLYDMCTCNL